MLRGSVWQPTTSLVRAALATSAYAAIAVVMGRPDLLVLGAPLVVHAVAAAVRRPRVVPSVSARLGVELLWLFGKFEERAKHLRAVRCDREVREHALAYQVANAILIFLRLRAEIRSETRNVVFLRELENLVRVSAHEGDDRVSEHSSVVFRW